MTSDRFEAVFSDFLDSRNFDAAQDAVYTLARDAFLAGWRAAGGSPDAPPPLSGPRELRTGRNEELDARRGNMK